MAQEIPFWNQQSSGLDELGGGSPYAINVVVDPINKTVRRRPGVSAYSEAPGLVDSGGIVGVYRTIGGHLYAVGGTPGQRAIYRISGGSSNNLSTALGNTLLDGAERPDFAETEMLLVVAGGNRLQKVELASNESDKLGGDPPKASHVIANSQRLVVNDVDEFRSQLRGSGFAQGTQTYEGHETWSGLDAATVTAEAKTDPVVAVHENTNEIFAFGTTTLQVFSPDPTFGYVPVATREIGCAAAYSVIKVDQSFAWLDHLRRFVLGDGRSLEIISDPIKATLDEIEDVSDCFGYRVVMGNLDCMIWTFPSDGRTFVFQKGSGWGQWQGWDPGQNNWKQLDVTAHFQEPGTGANIVGTGGGLVSQLQMGAFEDLVPEDTFSVLEFSLSSGPNDGDTLTITVAGVAYVFEADESSNGVTPGRIQVPAASDWINNPTAFAALIEANIPTVEAVGESGGDGLSSYTITSTVPGPVTMDASETGSSSLNGKTLTLGTSFAASPIVARVATGYLDRATRMRKHCQRVTLMFRRGLGETNQEPTGAWKASLRWRDQPGPWSDPLFASMGASTDRFSQVTFRSLGVYRERQWVLEYSGESDMVLIGADEEFEVLAD